MGKENDRIVYRCADGKWANRLFDDEIPTTIHDTQLQAIAAAKSLIKAQGGSLTVMSCDDRVTVKETIPPQKPPRFSGNTGN